MTANPVDGVGKTDLSGSAVFLSASIPDPARWEGQFDALQITDAVVAAARAILSASGTLVTAAHPTIAPLLLYVAGELGVAGDDAASVVVYQSSLFEDVLPEETSLLAEQGYGETRWTPASRGDRPIAGRWDASLFTMREQMLTETKPVAAIFIGGMEGIETEYRLFESMYRGRPVYPLGFPGGAARQLLEAGVGSLPAEVLNGNVYPTLFRAAVEDIVANLAE